ncbi:MAG: hypothetical protein U0610_17940 [bacterium]
MKRILLALLLVMCGCASWVQPTAAEIASADYGKYPQDVARLVDDYISRSFFDPHAVQDLKVDSPKKMWWIRREGRRYLPASFGYLVTFSCNSKNRLGGYLGIRTHRLFERDDSVVKEWTDEEWTQDKTWIGFGPAS